MERKKLQTDFVFRGILSAIRVSLTFIAYFLGAVSSSIEKFEERNQ
jgi:hypothetical protein